MEGWFNYTILGLFLVVFVAFALFSINNEETVDKPNVKNIEINGETYALSIADTALLRQKGLMNVSDMPENEGMLFIFDQVGYHAFWMKNTLIPLDMIWIDSKGEIVYIKENAQPCSNIVSAVCNSIFPKNPGLYVIELNAGQVSKLNLKVGDKIPLNL